MFETALAEKVFKQVNDLNPDLIVSTGDFFDGIGGNPEPFVAPSNRLLARRGVLFVTGSWGPPMRTPIRPEIVRIRLVSGSGD